MSQELDINEAALNLLFNLSISEVKLPDACEASKKRLADLLLQGYQEDGDGELWFVLDYEGEYQEFRGEQEALEFVRSQIKGCLDNNFPESVANIRVGSVHYRVTEKGHIQWVSGSDTEDSRSEINADG